MDITDLLQKEGFVTEDQLVQPYEEPLDQEAWGEALRRNKLELDEAMARRPLSKAESKIVARSIMQKVTTLYYQLKADKLASKL